MKKIIINGTFGENGASYHLVKKPHTFPQQDNQDI